MKNSFRVRHGKHQYFTHFTTPPGPIEIVQSNYVSRNYRQRSHTSIAGTRYHVTSLPDMLIRYPRANKFVRFIKNKKAL